jgi:lysozyme
VRGQLSATTSRDIISDMRPLNDAAIKLIKSYEGLVLRPYLCAAGVPTIGYGTTRYPDGQKVKLKDPPITVARAEEFFLHDLQDFSEGVEKNVRVELTDNQFGALVSFVYNVGIMAFINSSLLRRLNAGDYELAAEEFLKWVHAGGKRLPGLVKRREAERSLFLKPD